MAVRETRPEQMRPEQTRPEQTRRRIAGLVLVLLMATFGWSQPGLCCGPVCGMHAAVKAGQGFGQDSGDGQGHGAPATKMGAMHACCGSGSGSGAKVQTRDARPLSEMAECAAVRCDGMGRPRGLGRPGWKLPARQGGGPGSCGPGFSTTLCCMRPPRWHGSNSTRFHTTYIVRNIKSHGLEG